MDYILVVIDEYISFTFLFSNFENPKVPQCVHQFETQILTPLSLTEDKYYRDTNDLQLTNMEWTFPCSQSSFSDNSKDYNNFHILLSYSTWLTGFMRWNHWTRKLIQMIWLCIKCAINESSLLLQYLHFHTISDITRNFTRDQLIHFHSLEFSGKPSQYL